MATTKYFAYFSQNSMLNLKKTKTYEMEYIKLSATINLKGEINVNTSAPLWSFTKTEQCERS